MNFGCFPVRSEFGFQSFKPFDADAALLDKVWGFISLILQCCCDIESGTRSSYFDIKEERQNVLRISMHMSLNI